MYSSSKTASCLGPATYPLTISAYTHTPDTGHNNTSNVQIARWPEKVFMIISVLQITNTIPFLLWCLVRLCWYWEMSQTVLRILYHCNHSSSKVQTQEVALSNFQQPSQAFGMLVFPLAKVWAYLGVLVMVERSKPIMLFCLFHSVSYISWNWIYSQVQCLTCWPPNM